MEMDDGEFVRPTSLIGLQCRDAGRETAWTLKLHSKRGKGLGHEGGIMMRDTGDREDNLNYVNERENDEVVKKKKRRSRNVALSVVDVAEICFCDYRELLVIEEENYWNWVIS